MRGMGMSRRTLFKVGLGGTALLAVGGIGLSLQGSRLREPRRPLKVLDTLEFSVLAAFADRLAPHQPPFPTAWELQVAESVDLHLSTIHPGDATDFRKALALLESAVAGAIFDGRFRPFTACTPEAQDATMAAWRTSSVGIRRQAFRAMSGLCHAAYFGSKESYAAVGYPGPPDYGQGSNWKGRASSGGGS